MKYRSNSHAGLPKGSYMVPNPIHFHIARHLQLNRMMRPQIISLAFPSHTTNYLYNNQRRHFNIPTTTTRQSSSIITLNLANSRTVALDISMDTIVKFISPFVSALNSIRLPGFVSQASQTAFNTEETHTVEHTPLSIDSYAPNFSRKLETTSYEEEILNKLHNDLVVDLSGNESLESECVENEGLAGDLTPNTTKILQKCSDSDGETENEHQIEEKCNNVTITIKPEPEVDERLVKISTPIREYIIKQCLELRELILFPEVLHDPNLVKLLDELKCLYTELYGNVLSAEEKNELRISIGAYLMDGMTQENDRTNCSNDSDKLFSVSELISDILDNFFTILESDSVTTNSEENFVKFKRTLEEMYDLSSTLELDDATFATPQKSSPIVTSFKNNESAKTGAESFWFSITDASPVRETETVNFDDIPIPITWANRSSVDRTLSPILEEAQLKFDDDCNKENVDDFDSNSYFSFEEPEINVVVCNSGNFYRTTTVNSSAFTKSETVTFNRSALKCCTNVYLNENDPAYISNNINENSHSVESSDDEGDWMGFASAKF